MIVQIAVWVALWLAIFTYRQEFSIAVLSLMGLVIFSYIMYYILKFLSPLFKLVWKNAKNGIHWCVENRKSIAQNVNKTYYEVIRIIRNTFIVVITFLSILLISVPEIKAQGNLLPLLVFMRYSIVFIIFTLPFLAFSVKGFTVIQSNKIVLSLLFLIMGVILLIPYIIDNQNYITLTNIAKWTLVINFIIFIPLMAYDWIRNS